MIIQKPISYRPDPVNPRTTRLFFADHKAADFYMVGSIAWPEDKYPGFVLLSGQNLMDSEKKIMIFEEQEFWTIDNWLSSDGNLKTMPGNHGYWYGLSHFLNITVSKYGCRSYFYGGQHMDINRRYMNQFYRSNITPRPIDLIEVPYVNEVGNDLISEYAKLEKVRWDDNSNLCRLMHSIDYEENNGNRSFRCLLSGYETMPWIDIRRTGSKEEVTFYI